MLDGIFQDLVRQTGYLKILLFQFLLELLYGSLES